VYTDNATLELRTDQMGRAAVLVEPGEYGIGFTGTSGYERVDISPENPTEYVHVVLSKKG
jgi:hypothetical protein